MGISPRTARYKLKNYTRRLLTLPTQQPTPQRDAFSTGGLRKADLPYSNVVLAVGRFPARVYDALRHKSQVEGKRHGDVLRILWVLMSSTKSTWVALDMYHEIRRNDTS